jgi:DNA ligase (NAD+)
MSNKWDVLEIGPKVVENFVREANIKSLAQFLREIDNPKLDEICGKNAEKIRKNLKAAMSKKRTLANFISAFDIEDFGEKRLQSLIDAAMIDNVEALYNLSPKDIASIRGWTEESGEKVLEELAEIKKDLLEVSKLCNIGEEEKVAGGVLAGMSFCFTGAMAYKRADLEKMVVDNGGTVSSVNKTLTYLVQADPDSTSAKSEKAKKFGTAIITPEAFLEMLN